jgi:hypothetical protein
VTVVNLFEPGTSSDEWIRPLTGDACTASQVVAESGHSERFDLVFSNSLLEHVGGHANRVRLADEVDRLAPNHWIQTPYRYFPLEPHWLFPLMQFMPVSVRAFIAMHWPLAHTPADNVREATSEVQWTELVGISQLAFYFPTSRIIHERFLGMTKSLIAIR